MSGAGPVYEREYRGSKKRLYLEPFSNGSTTIRRKVTTIIPAPAPPPPTVVIEEPPPPAPPVLALPPAPPPPPVYEVPAPPPPEPETIDVIAVDVDPPERRRRHHHHRKHRSRDRELIIERERLVPIRVPVPVPVPVRQELETFRYVPGARPVSVPPRWRPRSPSLSPPPPVRRSSVERERINITIEDRHRDDACLRDERRYHDEDRRLSYHDEDRRLIDYGYVHAHGHEGGRGGRWESDRERRYYER